MKPRVANIIRSRTHDTSTTLKVWFHTPITPGHTDTQIPIYPSRTFPFWTSNPSFPKRPPPFYLHTKSITSIDLFVGMCTTFLMVQEFCYSSDKVDTLPYHIIVIFHVYRSWTRTTESKYYASYFMRFVLDDLWLFFHLSGCRCFYVSYHRKSNK